MLPETMYDYRYEAPKAVVIDNCNECGNDIHEGDTYYTFGTYVVCENCINDFIRQAKKEGDLNN